MCVVCIVYVYNTSCTVHIINTKHYTYYTLDILHTQKRVHIIHNTQYPDYTQYLVHNLEHHL